MDTSRCDTVLIGSIQADPPLIGRRTTPDANLESVCRPRRDLSVCLSFVDNIYTHDKLTRKRATDSLPDKTNHRTRAIQLPSPLPAAFQHSVVMGELAVEPSARR